MKQLNNLYAFLETQKIDLDESIKNNLKIYLKLIDEFGQQHNIISLNDRKSVVEKHFLSSLYYYFKTLSDWNVLLDIGSGGGFPGIILSICNPNKSVVLVDSNRKKTLFLKRVVKKLGLNTVVYNDRVENLHGRLPDYDIVTARALASVDTLIDLFKKSKKSVELHTIKGVNYLDETNNDNRKKIIEVSSIDKTWVDFSSYLEHKVYMRIGL